MKKTKLAVIRPNLRHKKRYVQLQLLTYNQSIDQKIIHTTLCRALQKQSGIFAQIESNITILETNPKTKELIIRINKEYLDEFIGSLFFAQSDLGLIKIKDIKSTIKKVK
ncbi:MAG: Rpp14/Pop5 family protein [archaeon]|jgi:RNase P/RNase MRP subunit POP5